MQMMIIYVLVLLVLTIWLNFNVILLTIRHAMNVEFNINKWSKSGYKLLNDRHQLYIPYIPIYLTTWNYLNSF